MLEAYGLTDRGCVRKNNEDYFLIEPGIGLYLVADGMGGAQAGEHASRLAAETVREVVGRGGSRRPALLVEAFEEANRRVFEAASRDPQLEGMGTTLVALLECDGRFEIASVGDSRCYEFHGGVLSLVTVDQTWVQELARRLRLDAERLRSHPMRHVLTMAIGTQRTLEIQTYTRLRRPGIQMLLSSDGLHGVIDEDRIAEALASERTLEAKCHYLIEAARQAGGPDNITAVVLKA
jgi:protein phosphatase